MSFQYYLICNYNKRMKSLLPFFFFLIPSFSFSTESTLNFDGNNDYISLGSIGTVHTIEFWMNADYPIDGIDNFTPLLSFNDLNNAYITTNNTFSFIQGETISLTMNGADIIYTNKVLTGGWHHIAFVSDGSKYTQIYIDGVRVNTHYGISGSAPAIIQISSAEIGAHSLSQNYYKGEIDELRFWNISRSEKEIQQKMCSKANSNSLELISYYDFNHKGTILKDIAGDIDGTLNNFDLSGNTSNWITSGVPIGDISVCNYPKNADWGYVRIQLSSDQENNFEINSILGNPMGIHLYKINNPPSNETSFLSSIVISNVYYGVFICDKTPLTAYNVIYNFSNDKEMVEQMNTSSLYYRSNNSDTKWTDLKPELVEDNLILKKENISRNGEFIATYSSLQNSSEIEEVLFNATPINENHTVSLSWQIISNVDIEYFTLERSLNGKDWENIREINCDNYADSYQEYDNQPYDGNSYYRLKQTNYEGHSLYTSIIPFK